jgi:hypothetical protein
MIWRSTATLSSAASPTTVAQALEVILTPVRIPDCGCISGERPRQRDLLEALDASKRVLASRISWPT